MESSGELDAARSARTLTLTARLRLLNASHPRRVSPHQVAGHALSHSLAILLSAVLLALYPAAGSPQATPSEVDQLVAAHLWDEVVRQVENMPSRTAELEYDYGSALAHLGRYQDAERALRAGERLAPRDPRFSTELAGIAFQQKRYSLAVHWLRRALRLAPGDAYANDFLGTVYFLEGNQLAALKYWNRAGKPNIRQILEAPTPRVSPSLLDHAFAFSPASRLTAAQLLDSETRIRSLGIFPQFHFDLNARSDGAFDVSFRNQETNGFGDSRLEIAAQFVRDLPFQGVAPECDNIARQAINVTTLLRWDAQKRRAFAQLSGPFEHSAKLRYVFQVDLRNENWDLRNSFTGVAPVFASLNLLRQEGLFQLASSASDRFQWKAGAELSQRDFRNVQPGVALTSSLLAPGFQLKQTAEVQSTLLRVPERRFVLDAHASSQAARLWSQPVESFEKLEGSLGWHWFPQARGDDYAMEERIRAGKTFGQIPFDELFVLGLERDTDLPMHAHIGTRDGRKGSAPLGRNYLLHSFEADKDLYSNGLLAVKLGPLLDIGAISDSNASLGSHQWLFDLGAQIKLRVFSTTVALSYGRDLRAGHNAFYAEFVPAPQATIP